MPGILASDSERSKDRAITTEVTVTAAIAAEEREKGEKNEKKKRGNGKTTKRDLCPDSLPTKREEKV